jgi:hypothetical protein
MAPVEAKTSGDSFARQGGALSESTAQETGVQTPSARLDASATKESF